MWRNFRIRTKMMIGFVLVLAVFVVSGIISWSLMNTVSAESARISDAAVPAEALCSSLNDSTYELFIAMRTMQYTENEASFAEVGKWRAEIEKTMGEITAFHKELSTMSTTYTVENVIPHMHDYFEAIDQYMKTIEEKKAADGVLVTTGRTMSESINTFVTKLWDYLESENPSGDPVSYRKHLTALRRANTLALRILDARRMLLHFNDTRDLENAKGMVKSLQEIYGELESFSGALTVPENRAMMETLMKNTSEYIAATVAYTAVIDEMNAVNGKRNAAHDVVNKETSRCLQLSQERVVARTSNSLTYIKHAMTLLLASTVLAILLGLAVAFLISRSIANPLAVIVGQARRAGSGDLTVTKEDFRYDGEDELGSLTDELSAMVDAQKDAMGQVITVSGSLADSADKLSTIAERTNALMEEVKASIDQVSNLGERNGATLEECNANIEEMSAGADTVARSATDSAAFISQMTETSGKAIQAVSKVISGMRSVDANAKESENKIRHLVDSVEKVGSFISVITGIADQTNLLALNAAIEAARAGDVGRGFAVVAEEVRQLAEESSRAAQNVNGIIVELQSGAQESIKATAEAGRRLGDTLAQAEQTQEDLNMALKEMQKANDAIQSIAAVAQEQAASSKEMAQAIDNATKSTIEMVEIISNIHKASEDTAQAAEDVAEHSEGMNGHAADLMEVLSRFKLNVNEQREQASAKKTVVLKALKAG